MGNLIFFSFGSLLVGLTLIDGLVGPNRLLMRQTLLLLLLVMRCKLMNRSLMTRSIAAGQMRRWMIVGADAQQVPR